MSAAFNAGSIEGTLDLDTSPFAAGLRWARGEAQKFEKTKVTVKAKLDTGELDAKDTEVKAKLDELGAKKVSPKVDVNTGDAMAKVAILNRVLDAGGLGGHIAGPGAMAGKLGSLVGGLLSVTAAALPTAAALGAVGLAAGAAMAGAGISIGLFAKVATSDFAKIQDATKKGLNLSGPAGVAQRALKGVTDAWHNLQKATAPQTYAVLGAAFGTLQGILPRLAPLINTVGRGLQGVIGDLAKLTQSKAFAGFLSDLQGFAKGFTGVLGPAIVGVLRAMMSGFHQIQPVFSVLGEGILKAVHDLDGFMSGGGFSAFVKFALANLPLVEHLIGNAFHLIGSLVTGLSPLMHPALAFINALVGALAGLNIAPLSHGFADVLDVLKPLLPVAVQLINVVFKPLGKFIGELAQGPLAQLAHALGPELQPAFKDLGTLLGALSGPLATFIGSIANLANPTGVKLFTSLLHILTGVVQALAGPLAAIGVVLESVVDTALEAAVPILAKVAPLFEYLAKLIGHNLATAAKLLAPVFGQVVHTLFPALQKVIVALMPPIRQVAATLFPALIKVIKSLIPVIGPLMGIIVELITKVIIPVMIPALKLAADQFSFMVPKIVTVIGWIAKGLTWFLKFAQGPQQAQHAVKVAWDWITQRTADFYGWFHQKLTSLENFLRSLGSWLTSAWQNFWRNVFDWITQRQIRFGQDILSGFNKLRGWAADLGNWISRPFVAFFTDAYDLIKKGWHVFAWALQTDYNKIIKPIWGWIKTALSDVKQAFKTGVSDIGKIWDGLKAVAEAPVKFMVNTVLDNGIVAAVNKVGGIFPGFKAVPTFHLPFAHGGLIPGNSPHATADDQLIRATSDEFMVRQPSSRKLRKKHPGLLEYMNAYGDLPGYAGGGFITKLLESATPVGLATSGIQALINKIPGAGSPETSMLTHASGALLSGLKKWIGEKLNPVSLGTALGEKIKGLSGYSASGGVARWAPLILQALAMLHQPASLLGDVESRMQRESGGNPTIFNNWDANAKRGTPSGGLMQVIAPTFAAYAGPLRGRGMLDPLANIYAGLNYALHAYPSIAYAMMKPGGYASGVLKSVAGYRWIGENGPELMKLPGGSSILSNQRSVQLARSGAAPVSNSTDNAVLSVLQLIAKHLAAQPTKDDQQALLDALGKITNSAVKTATTTARAHA